MIWFIRKWLQTISVGVSQYLAYKLNFVLLILGPTLVFFFIKYNLWTAIFAMDGVDQIRGYDLSTMLQYQIWVMVVGFLAQSYNSMNLAEDIRLGRISSHLIYPFSFWSYHASRFISIQIVQVFITALSIGIALSFGLIPFDVLPLAKGVLLSLFVGFLWFQISYLIGLLAFWLEETWVLRVMFLTMSQFFSGAIIPLELYPTWAQKILFMTPFPYLTFIPARIFMDNYQGSYGLALVWIVVWIFLVISLVRWVWAKGIRHYTAAGM